MTNDQLIQFPEASVSHLVIAIWSLVIALLTHAVVAQSVEHVIGNDEVIGSIPINGSRENHENSAGTRVSMERVLLLGLRD
jgi:hypothetical protein